MNIPQIKLNDQNSIPQLGYGLWQVKDEEAEGLIKEAIGVGYRLIDSAQIYQNETGLGDAIRNSGTRREELFITTKIWNSEQGYDSTLSSFEISMKKLGLEKLDLLLIHWPAPKKNLYLQTWKALIELKNEGRVRSIGVSNFNIDHLEKIINETGVVPAINQVEVHPRFQRRDLRAFHQKHNIVTEAWSPLGQGHLIQDDTLLGLAKKYGKSTAQIILRWHMDEGLVAIPKTVTLSRMWENINVFDFSLDAQDRKLISGLDDPNGRIGPDPMTATF